jgi:hypothetical protein
MSERDYHQEYVNAIAYYKARNVDINQGFYERINEYGLAFEVLVTAYNYCRSAEQKFNRELTGEEICVELNCAASDWDV